MPKNSAKNGHKVASRKIQLKKKVILGARTSFSTLEERARALIENMDLPCWMGDKDEVTIYANPAFCELTGYSLDELVGREAFLYWTKESEKHIREINRTDRQSGVSSSYEGTMVTKKGNKIPVSVHGTPLLDGATVGIMRDLRDQKQQEAQIEDLLKRFELAIRGSKDALWYAEIPVKELLKFNLNEDYFVWCSDRFKKVFGFKGKLPNSFGQWRQHIHQDDIKRITKEVKQHIRNRSAFEIQCRLRVNSGEYRWFLIRGEGVPEKSNGTLLIAGSLRDIEDRKQTEHELVASKKLFDDLVQGSPTAMFVINLNHEIIYWNKSMEGITGLKADEMIGSKDHWKPFYGKQRDMITDMIVSGMKNREILKYYKHMDVEECSDKNGIVGSVYFTSFRGQKRWLRFIIKPLRDPNNKIIGAVETVEDITERKAMSDMLAKRIREFQVLYQVNSHIQMVLPIARVLNNIKKDLALACREPKFARARITFDGKTYTNLKANEKLVCKISEPIKVLGKERGRIELGYMVDMCHDDGPVLRDEKKLLQIISQTLSKHVRSREVIERYQKLVNKSVTGIYIVQDSLFQYVNPKFKSIFKVKEADAINQSFSSLVIGCDCIGKILKNNKVSSIRCDAKGKRSDGTVVDLEVISQQIYYYGRPAVLGTIQDVTKLKEAQEKLRTFNRELKEKVDQKTKDLEEANRRLLSLNELKDEFIAVTSHELRSPLTAIRGYLSFLKDKKLYGCMPDEAKEYLERAYDNVEILNNLMNNILDVSRIDTNRLELHLTEVDLIEMVENVIRNLSFQAESKQLDLRFDNQLGVSKLVCTLDNVRMRQVMRNILENAIKYTPRRKQITITLQHKGIGVEMAIQDQGVGIPKSQIFHIFDKFKQAKNHQARYKGGAGLGLFIAKRIIELHGGMIWAESQMRKGTTFYIQLPLDTDEPN